MKMYRPHRLCPRNSKPKEPSLYRSLCVSILCMFLSTVMLVGTTMAWFSDSLQTGVYTISSANFTVTTFFCTDLADGSGANNWQRLNPGNTTMFGGGSLSSGSYQTAYLKIVNASNIDLKYTLTITNTVGETDSTLPLSLAYKEVSNEADLKTAFTSTDESSTQSGESTSTDTEISFTVPKATTMDGAATPTIKFVALKLSLNVTPTSSTNDEQPATQYKFGLHLAITQNLPEAQVTDSNSPTTSTSVDMTITGSTASTPDTTASDPANGSDKVTPQPDDGNNSGGNHTETPSGSPTETKNPTETPESGNGGNAGTTGTTSDTSDTDTSGGNGDAPAAGSEPAPDPTT